MQYYRMTIFNDVDFYDSLLKKSNVIFFLCKNFIEYKIFIDIVFIEIKTKK